MVKHSAHSIAAKDAADKGSLGRCESREGLHVVQCATTLVEFQSS